MSTHAEILAAIKAHRRAVAEYAQADEPRQMAGWRLLAMRPQCREGALAFFGYLATLEDELEPGLAQMAAVCLDRLGKGPSLPTDSRQRNKRDPSGMCCNARKVIRGPAQWFSRHEEHTVLKGPA
jgi:hypothetical protein